jgi:hypothetical protein
VTPRRRTSTVAALGLNPRILRDLAGAVESEGPHYRDPDAASAALVEMIASGVTPALGFYMAAIDRPPPKPLLVSDPDRLADIVRELRRLSPSADDATVASWGLELADRHGIEHDRAVELVDLGIAEGRSDGE